MKKIITSILLITICLFTLSGCNKEEEGKGVFSKTDFYFDTVVSITVYNEKDRPLINECFKLCKEYEDLFNKNFESSDIYKINHSNEPVKVDEKTADIIENSLKYCKDTKGVFDITIEPLVRLWDIKAINPKVPDDAKIKELLPLINYRKVKVNEGSVSISNDNPEAGIDLGGIAKGYIADRLKEFLLDNGVDSALIALGGNIMTVGSKDGGNFKIGIKKPFTEANESMATVAIQDKSVVTSGIYERYFVENEKIYHHIIDTSNGYPADNELTSVTIISDSSMDGDVYSTTALLLGLKEGKIFIKNHPGLEAVFIDNEENIYLTDGLYMNENKVITLK